MMTRRPGGRVEPARGAKIVTGTATAIAFVGIVTGLQAATAANDAAQARIERESDEAARDVQTAAQVQARSAATRVREDDAARRASTHRATTRRAQSTQTVAVAATAPPAAATRTAAPRAATPRASTPTTPRTASSPKGAPHTPAATKAAPRAATPAPVAAPAPAPAPAAAPAPAPKPPVHATSGGSGS